MTPPNENDTFTIGDEYTVNRLGYGAMRITGEDIIGPPDDEENALAVIREAVDSGVDFIDTADAYGPGTSERLIGEAIDAGREDVVVATKGGKMRDLQANWPENGDPTYLENALQCSRDRLGVDTIDLYQLHAPDPDHPFEDSVQTLAEFKDRGYVDHVGLSNVTVDQIETARDIVDVATVQNHYNVGHREHEDVLRYCEQHEIGFVPYYPLGAGSFGDAGAVIQDVAASHDASSQQVALAWLLAHSPVTLPIPGTSSLAHLEDNVAAASLPLTDEEMERLTAAAAPA